MRIMNSISEFQYLSCHKPMRGIMVFAFFMANVVEILLNLSLTSENIWFYC